MDSLNGWIPVRSGTLSRTRAAPAVESLPKHKRAASRTRRSSKPLASVKFEPHKVSVGMGLGGLLLPMPHPALASQPTDRSPAQESGQGPLATRPVAVLQSSTRVPLKVAKDARHKRLHDLLSKSCGERVSSSHQRGGHRHDCREEAHTTATAQDTHAHTQAPSHSQATQLHAPQHRTPPPASRGATIAH